MCVLSIKVPLRKKSGNLSYAPRIYIYIYIYIYMCVCVCVCVCVSVCVCVFIAVGNRHSDSSSNPGRSSLHLTKCKYSWETNESNFSSSSYGLMVRQTEFFIFFYGNHSWRRKTLNSSPLNSLLEIELV